MYSINNDNATNYHRPSYKHLQGAQVLAITSRSEMLPVSS